jgi:hypothetical protein
MSLIVRGKKGRWEGEEEADHIDLGLILSCIEMNGVVVIVIKMNRDVVIVI